MPNMRYLGCFLLASFCFVAGASAGVIIWDNDIEPDGFNGRAVSPPLFPDILVADDFSMDHGFEITDFHANVTEDVGWEPGSSIEVIVYFDDGGEPGNVAGQVTTTDWMRTPTGEQIFDRDAYEYWVDNLSISLDAGMYWIGFRNPDATGDGTNFWMTSTGGPDGAGTSTGFVSFNAGSSWDAEGAGWQHAFEITGSPSIPEPATVWLLGVGLLALTGRARRVRAEKRLS